MSLQLGVGLGLEMAHGFFKVGTIYTVGVGKSNPGEAFISYMKKMMKKLIYHLFLFRCFSVRFPFSALTVEALRDLLQVSIFVN